MMTLREYFKQTTDLDQAMNKQLSSLIRRALPGIAVYNGYLVFAKDGDYLTEEETYQVVRELMLLTGITEKSSNSSKRGKK